MNPIFLLIALVCVYCSFKTNREYLDDFPPLGQIHAFLKCIGFGEYALSFEDDPLAQSSPPDHPFWDRMDQMTDGLQVVKLSVKIAIHNVEQRLIKWLKNHPELRSIKIARLESSDFEVKAVLLDELAQMPHLERVTLRGFGPISKASVVNLAKNPTLSKLNLEVPLKPALQVEELNKLLPLVPNIQHLAFIEQTNTPQKLKPSLQSLLLRWQSGTKLQFDASALTCLHITYLTQKTIPWIKIPSQLSRLTLCNWASADWPAFFDTLSALPALTDLRLPSCKTPSSLIAKYMEFNQTLTTLDVTSMHWEVDFDKLDWLLTNTTLTTFQFPRFSTINGQSKLTPQVSAAWLQKLLQCNTTLTHLAFPCGAPELYRWTTTLLRFDGDKSQLYCNRVRHTSLAEFCLPKTKKIWHQGSAISKEIDDYSKQPLSSEQLYILDFDL